MLAKAGVTGFHPASRTEQMVAEIGPVALLQRRTSFDRICIVFLQSLQTLRFVSFFDAAPHRDPLADLLDPGGKLRHTVDSEKPGYRGDCACMGLAHCCANFQIPAHRLDLRSGSTSLCAHTLELVESQSS